MHIEHYGPSLWTVCLKPVSIPVSLNGAHNNDIHLLYSRSMKGLAKQKTFQSVFLSTTSAWLYILAIRPNTFHVLPEPTTTQNIFRQQNLYLFTFSLLVMVRKIAVSCQTQRPRMNYIWWHQYHVTPLTGRTLCITTSHKIVVTCFANLGAHDTYVQHYLIIWKLCNTIHACKTHMPCYTDQLHMSKGVLEVRQYCV